MKKRVSRTSRGFAVYACFKDLYGKQIKIVKSSLATQDAVWIQNEIEYCDSNATPLGNAHLTRPMAKRVIKALQDFVNGVE